MVKEVIEKRSPAYCVTCKRYMEPSYWVGGRPMCYSCRYYKRLKLRGY